MSTPVPVFVAIVLLTVLAGYPVAVFIAPKAPLGHRLVLSIVFSYAITLLLAFFVHFTHFPTTALRIIIPTAILVTVICTQRLQRHSCCCIAPNRWDWCLILASGVTGLRTYAPHHNYPFPLHSDEYYIAWSAASFARQGVLISDPSVPSAEVYRTAINGFLGLLLRLTGSDPLHAFRILPAWFATLTAFAGGVLVTAATRDSRWGALGAAMFSLVTCDSRILGTELFVASTYALPLTMIVFGSEFLQMRPSWRPTFIALVLALRCICHPSTAVLVCICALWPLAKTATSSGPLKVHWKTYRVPIAILAVLALAAAATRSQLGVGTWVALVFPFNSDSGIDKKYGIESLAGPVPLALSALGAVWAIRRRRVVALTLCFGLLILICQLAPVLRLTVTARYERLFYESQVLSIPLGAFGLRLIHGAFPTGVANARLWTRAVVGILLLFSCIWTVNQLKRDRYWHYMDSETYESLTWIGRHLDRKSLILALPGDALVLRTMGFSTTETLPRSNTPPPKVLEILEFFGTNDPLTRERILDRLRPDVVFSRTPIPCSSCKGIAAPDGALGACFLYRYEHH